MRPMKLTQQLVKTLFHYDPGAGALNWKSKTSKYATRSRIGETITTRGAAGYINITIYGKKHSAHRIIWLYVYGKWPTHEIDHINGIRTDNRIANLREATRSQNRQNRRARYDLKGITPVRNRWQAQITQGGKNIYLGLYATKEEAHAAYWDAAQKYFGEFARAK